MTDRARRAAFQSHLAAAGVRISGLGNLFLSSTHTGDVIDSTVERFDRALRSFLSG
ncbi:MAG: hypothetical protein OXH89_01125 [bacterium]|nr:hypothetical protein [bacterium]